MDSMAIRVWNMVNNGMGGIDYSGIGLVCAYLGVSDVDGLLTRLAVIKTHKPPEAAHG